MRHDDDRALASQFVDALLNRDLRLMVQRVGGLVQDQDLRSSRERPGQRDTLPLPPDNLRPRAPTSVS